MPIQARLDAAGILHPVIGYWIERTKIFKFIQKQRPANTQTHRFSQKNMFMDKGQTAGARYAAPLWPYLASTKVVSPTSHPFSEASSFFAQQYLSPIE